ncbi:MAG: hypothetical protein M3P95_11250 [Actinomycetota bacterium]|nr:hypothetical protein [Actinomycetota bacterium]
MTSTYWDCRSARWEGGEPEHVVPAWADSGNAAPPAPAAVPAAPAQREPAEDPVGVLPGDRALLD